MIRLCPFYRRINFGQEGKEVSMNAHLVNYRECLNLLLDTFLRSNPTNDYLVCTDQNTELALPSHNIFRHDLTNMNLMQSLVVSNTSLVKQHQGRMVLCGVDHLIINPLDIMFEDEFDIGVMYFEDRVNNTVVLVKSDEHNAKAVSNFFRIRERMFLSLPPAQKMWDGDQISIRMALDWYGFDRDPNRIIDTIQTAKKLRVKFWRYNERYVSGVIKKKPRYDKNAVMIDFKGPVRKQWFKEVYQSVNANHDHVSIPRSVPAPELRDRQGVAMLGPWTSATPLPLWSTITQRKHSELAFQPMPDFWIIWNNLSNKRRKSFPAAYQMVKQTRIPTMVVELPIFRHRKMILGDISQYYRWSWFSYFRDRGIHYHEDSDSDRWERLKHELYLEVEPWQPRGESILFMMQKPRDNSMALLRQQWGSWEAMFSEAATEIRKHSDRPIRIRLHPSRHAQQMEMLKPLLRKFTDVAISEHSVEKDMPCVVGGDSLQQDLDQTWAVVGGNSNGLVDCALAGIPIWVMHPSAMAWPVRQRSFADIEAPNLHVPRLQWLYNLAYSQWRLDEVRDGAPIRHLMQWWEEVKQRVNTTQSSVGHVGTTDEEDEDDESDE